MATLLDRRLRTSRIVFVTTEHARAIGDPIRSKILSMLYGQTLSAEEITAAINKTGLKKAIPTVRHHIDILKTTGLIEVTKIVETRGGITKYYGTSTRLLDFKTSDDFDSAYSPVIDKTAKRLEDILDGVFSDVAASTAKPVTAEHSVHLVVDIMNRAITKVLEKSKKRVTKKAPKSSKKAATQSGKKNVLQTTTTPKRKIPKKNREVKKSASGNNGEDTTKETDND